MVDDHADISSTGTNSYAFRAKDEGRLAKIHSSKSSRSRHPDKPDGGKFHEGFPDKSDFIVWWQNQYDQQNGKCEYCGTSFEILANLFDREILGKRKTAGQGHRGKFPELDRVDPHGSYAKSNCVLACYCCNNDKSHVYLDQKWRDYIGRARGQYFQWLYETRLLKL
ncbi:MAG: HNH endonuclease [Pseudolabrys sp.]